MILTKAFLQELLQTTDLQIKFKKKDGTKRDMHCTLRKEVLPIRSEKQEEKPSTKKENDDVLAVWDLEKKAFRSFRLDSIIEYKQAL